jgi:ABC-type amino acid transport substrate-binding protein
MVVMLATRSFASRSWSTPAAAGLGLLVWATACAEPADRPSPDADPASGSVVEAERTGPAGPVVATSFAEARASGEAELVFFHVPSGGFAYRDGEGRLTGVTVELLRDFAAWVAETRGMDLRVEWVAEERWADFYGYVRDSEGGVFGIGNVTITEPRRQELDFSPPYLNNVAVLVTHEAIPELESMDELPATFAGLTALPYPGTLHEARLEAIRDRWLPDIPTRPVTSNDELVALLASEPRYFGYIDVYNYWRAREAGHPLRRHAVADDASETFGIIMPHHSDWAPVMDDFFQADGGYATSPRFEALLRHHLGDDLAASVRVTR